MSHLLLLTTLTASPASVPDSRLAEMGLAPCPKQVRATAADGEPATWRFRLLLPHDLFIEHHPDWDSPAGLRPRPA